ncbi:MAG: S8 family serine peptidase [Acidobacteriota bacterium]
MKRLLLILFSLLCLPVISQAQTPDPARAFAKGEVIVEIKPGASIEAINERHRTTVLERLYGTNFYRLRTPKNKSEIKWRKRLSKDADVLSAALNPVISSPSLFGRSTFSFPEGFATPGFHHADFSAQQPLFDWLKLNEVQKRATGEGIVVAIIDTGIDRLHPLLQNKIWRDARARADVPEDNLDNDLDGLLNDSWGWDFVDHDNDPTEKPDDPQKTVAGHGTFIAGLVTLLAPDARILPVRAFPADGQSDAFTVASAIKYAADHGAQVINLSLGSPEVSELLQSAIEDARARGIIVVAAVGNDNDEKTPQFPSNMESILAVAAVELSGQKAPFSNFGAHVDVCAPGSKLISAYPGASEESFAVWSGTSFAAPLAAAEAALIFSADPKNPDVKKLIEETAQSLDAVNPGLAGKLGKGRIDPLNALQMINSSDAIRPINENYAQTDLSAVALPEAKGRASIIFSDARQIFRLEAYNLSVRTSYKLFIDGKDLTLESPQAERSVTPLGTIRYEFSTEPGKVALPASLNPVSNIHHIEVRDASGGILILQGDLKTEAPEIVRALEKEARLLSPATVAKVGGRANVKILNADQILRIEADALTSDTAYAIFVDGVFLGTRFADSGFIRAQFSNNPSFGQLLPPALLPLTNVRLIELRNLRGEVILRGQFSAVPVAASPIR